MEKTELSSTVKADEGGDSTKAVEHVRYSHFYLVIACVVAFFAHYLVSDNLGKNAQKELNLIESIIDNWTPEKLNELAIKAYELDTGENILRSVEGKITLGDKDGDVFFSHSSLAEDNYFPYEYKFIASATTVLTNDTYLSHKNLKLFTEKYQNSWEHISEFVPINTQFKKTSPMRHRLEKPTSVREFADFWNILHLNHELVVMKPYESAKGVFHVSQHIGNITGKASIIVEDTMDKDYSSDFWYFVGSIQPNKGSFADHMAAFPLDEAWVPANSSEKFINEFVPYYRDIENNAGEQLLFLSVDVVEGVPMAAYGSGWMGEFSTDSSAKDMSVPTEVFFPVPYSKISIHPQNLFIAELPIGYPGKSNFFFGDFKRSFPYLDKLIAQLGISPFSDVKERLKEIIKAEKNETSISFAGVSLPLNIMLLFGSLFIVLFQSYYYLHLANLVKLLLSSKNDDQGWAVPWIGLYHYSYVAKISLLLTTILLPVSVVAHNLYQGGLGIVNSSALIFAFCFSIATLIEMVKLWREQHGKL